MKRRQNYIYNKHATLLKIALSFFCTQSEIVPQVTPMTRSGFDSGQSCSWDFEQWYDSSVIDHKKMHCSWLICICSSLANPAQDVWWRRNPETCRNVVFLRKYTIILYYFPVIQSFVEIKTWNSIEFIAFEFTFILVRSGKDTLRTTISKFNWKSQNFIL